MSNPKIRFGLPFVPVSVIAEQWYCERAVELSQKHPSINFVSPEMAMGTAQHELLASEAEGLTKKQIMELIKGGKKASLIEVGCEASFHGIRLRGTPDYISIKSGRALFLLDYKFSKHKRVFPSHRIQVDTYGFLLNRNHLKTDNLVCGIAVIDPGQWEREAVLNDLAPRLLAEVIRMNRKQAGVRYLEGPGVYGQLYPFSLDNTKRNLVWATDYWRGRRKAIPTKKAYKCRACQFEALGLCKSALLN